MGKYVFVSHSSEDKKLVEKVVNQIEKRGIRCWISSRDIKPGRDYQKEIVSSLKNSTVVLLLFSQNANKSTEIPRELSLASNFKKLMIPARMENIVPSEAFQYPMSNAQVIDLFENFDKKIQDLCDSITEYMATEGGQISPLNLSKGSTGRKYWPIGASALALLIAAGASWAFLHHDNAPPPSTRSNSSTAPGNIVSKEPEILPKPPISQPAISASTKSTAQRAVEPAPSSGTQSAAKPAMPSHIVQKSTLPIAIGNGGAGSSVASKYPAAKIVSWYPLSNSSVTLTSNFLDGKDPVWTVNNSQTGQMRLAILLSPDMVALDHIVLRLKSGSDEAMLPKTAIISLSGSHNANPNSFRYVSTCALTSPGVTRCDFGSQFARAISVELYRENKPITDTMLSIGF
jgi:hypothetical protein